jgi:uncharacterized protein
LPMNAMPPRLLTSLFTGGLQVDQITLPIANLPDRLQGLKIVQMSDLHYDPMMLSEDLLQAAIVATNQTNPDLIVLTGDFIAHKPEPIYALTKRLQALRSRYGVFAVLGNHDLIYRHSRSTITDALTKVDIPVLWNQVVYPCGEGLALVGLPDFWHQEFQPQLALDRIPQEIPRVVLSHNPDSAAVLQKWRVDLQLSGHTHGGQIVIPRVGNLSAIVAQQYDLIPEWLKNRFPVLKTSYRVVKNWDWVSGLHTLDNPIGGQNQLYVNRGLGTYPPGRLFCPPEVTVIQLTSDRAIPPANE